MTHTTEDPMYPYLVELTREGVPSPKVQLLLRDVPQPMIGTLTRTGRGGPFGLFAIVVDASDGTRAFTLEMVFRAADVVWIALAPTESRPIVTSRSGILLE